jgi:hypothetical protein
MTSASKYNKKRDHVPGVYRGQPYLQEYAKARCIQVTLLLSFVADSVESHPLAVTSICAPSFVMLGLTQLPSPPSTSHREEKENRPLLGHISRVSWSEKNKVHPLTSSSSSVNVKPSASYDPPTKSILRKVTSFPFTDLPCEAERDITPEPELPLLDSSYLAGPVSRIITPGASLKDLIQSYNILAARVRTRITNDADLDASKPLFLPLKDNAHEFVHAIVRDLGRVMTDPNDLKEQVPKLFLPSPRPSPDKKKRGMSEDQVRYARDLGTTTHSVIKFLALLFSSPSLCQVFDGMFIFFSVRALKITNYR